HPARVQALSLFDLFRGIGAGTAKSTKGIVVGQPAGVPLYVDIYQPASSGTFPILVQIYGGAWQPGAPADNAAVASLLASHGWVVFAIDYRHAPRFRWPAQLDDVRAALGWIGDHAASYGGDTSRVALIGRSAGAQLAMMAAYTHPPLSI